MGEISDQGYLLNDQYRDAANLQARIELHVRCSTNRYGWHPWVFDQLELAAQSRVLELGCGPGQLWLQNLARVPSGWEVTLSDLSPGMLDEARRNLAASAHSWRFEVIDAQAIPFPDASFDGVIANHMLYHVPDRPRALAEIRRVLRPGGRFYAATTGLAHMADLWALVRRFDPGIRTWKSDGGSALFSLESGAAELEQLFAHVRVRRYVDALIVTEAEPLVDFVLSGMTDRTFDAEAAAALRRFVEAELAEHGPIRIAKDSGLFVAC